MPITQIHECECEDCQHEEVEHPNRALHRRINVLASRLDEQQRRWFVALESNRFGHGGDVLMSKITGLDEKTIRRGRWKRNSWTDRRGAAGRRSAFDRKKIRP